MFKFKVLLFAFAILCAGSLAMMAQNETPNIDVKVNGTVQSWASFAQTDADTNQVGFGLRRVRGRMKVGFGEKIKGFVQYEATAFKLLDARIEYHFSKNLQLSMGRFIGAGVRAGGLTSHTQLDIIERSATAQYWGRKTVGADYRDYGAELIGRTGDFTGRLWLHNGNGAVNVKPSQGSTASIRNESISASAMAIIKPKSIKGLEAGAHIGKGNSELGSDYSDYSAYVYLDKRPVRFKAELVSLTEKDVKVTKAGDADQTFLGYYLFAAARASENFEVVGRFEVLDKDTDIDNNQETYITLGGTYAFYPEKWINSKVTAAYVIHNEGDALVDTDNNVFYLMWQLVF